MRLFDVHDFEFVDGVVRQFEQFFFRVEVNGGHGDARVIVDGDLLVVGKLRRMKV